MHKKVPCVDELQPKKGRVAIIQKRQVVRQIGLSWKLYGPAASEVARHLPYYDINWSGTGHQNIYVF